MPKKTDGVSREKLLEYTKDLENKLIANKSLCLKMEGALEGLNQILEAEFKDNKDG